MFTQFMNASKLIQDQCIKNLLQDDFADQKANLSWRIGHVVNPTLFAIVWHSKCITATLVDATRVAKCKPLNLNGGHKKGQKPDSQMH